MNFPQVGGKLKHHILFNSYLKSAYMSFVNHTLKSDADNPTIGLLICKSKDNIFAQYSLEGYNQPIGISEFEGVNLLPKEFKSSLPSIEDIEAELEKNSKQ